MYFTGLTILSILSSVKPLKCISMNNQERKVRIKIVTVNSDKPAFFFLLALKQVNVVVVVIISIINMQNCVFVML